MPRMVSLATKIEQLRAMLGTDDLTDWEQEFVGSVQARYSTTRTLTDKQIEILEQIWNKHFA